jgi:hypothetical protein
MAKPYISERQNKGPTASGLEITDEQHDYYLIGGSENFLCRLPNLYLQVSYALRDSIEPTQPFFRDHT